jgi:hypothetical protein
VEAAPYSLLSHAAPAVLREPTWPFFPPKFKFKVKGTVRQNRNGLRHRPFSALVLFRVNKFDSCISGQIRLA